MSIVMKFGGSSVGSTERIKNVMRIIIRAQTERGLKAVVLSAFSGVTDQLITMGECARKRDESYLTELEGFRGRHLKVWNEVVGISRNEELGDFFKRLQDVLHGIYLTRELTNRTLDYVMSFGERLSNFIVACALNHHGHLASYTDSRPFIKATPDFGSGRVLMESSFENLQTHFEKSEGIQLVTGFIASTDDNETVTLGRGGSDYTAALIAAALGVDELEIWTDVSGILTADPRKVKDSFPLPYCSFEEAMEMSHFGAKVIYPPTMVPVMSRNIPIRIKNTLEPNHPGTCVSRSISAPHQRDITGISSIDEIGLLQLKGCGMIGVSGISARLFGALSQSGINVIMISQASSEHAICVAIPPGFLEKAKLAIDTEFQWEIQSGTVDPVTIRDGYSIVAVVGEEMRHKPGIAGRVFSALGDSRVNVSAIAQGSSERNISFIVESKDEAGAIQAIHRRFFSHQTNKSPVSVCLVGPGGVGRKVLQLLEREEGFRTKWVVTRSSEWFNPEGVALNHLDTEPAQPSDPKKLLETLLHWSDPCVFVDCTASPAWVPHYKDLLASGIPVVTPNKLAATGSWESFQELTKNEHFYFEGNVGAGLPVLSTLRQLLLSGDEVVAIEGVLSGTLSYLFNRYKGDMPFSQLVRHAWEKGYTEPNPEADLNGMDAARKILILARLCGQPFSLENVKIESLVPESCRNSQSAESFLSSFSQSDAMFKQRFDTCYPQKLVYLASFRDGVCQVGLRTVSEEHPAFHLQGTDNLVAFYTRRYSETPLVIQGAGAGIDVTAGQVYAEILSAGSNL